MSRESIVILIGIVLLFVPFLGIPSEWKQYMLTASGILLLIIGYLLRRAAYYRRTDRGNGERGNDSFEESSVKTTKAVTKPMV